MPLVIESKPSASASRACSRSSWKRAVMSSPSGNCARSIRPNFIGSARFERGLCPRNPGGGSEGAVEAPFDWLAGFSQRQIDPAAAGERMLAIRQGGHAVEREPGGAAPHDDVAALEPDAARPILTSRAAEEEHRRQSER